MACEDRAEGPSDIHRSWLPSYGSTWTHGSWLLGSGVLGCADRWCTPIPTVYHWVNSGHVKWQIQALHLHTSHMGQAALPRCLAPSTFCRDVDIYIYFFYHVHMATWRAEVGHPKQRGQRELGTYGTACKATHCTCIRTDSSP